MIHPTPQFASPSPTSGQCADQNPPLQSFLRHPYLHQTPLRLDGRKPKPRPTGYQQQGSRPRVLHQQHLLSLQHSRLLPTNPLIRIHDPLQFLRLIRYPPLQPPILTIPMRHRLPLQPATLRKSLPPRSTNHLPHVREPSLPPSPPSKPATATATNPPAPTHHALLRLLSHAKQLRAVHDLLQSARGEAAPTGLRKWDLARFDGSACRAAPAGFGADYCGCVELLNCVRGVGWDER